MAPRVVLKLYLLFLSTRRLRGTLWREYMCLLDKLHSDVSYSAVGCEFNVTESTTYSKYSAFKQKCT